MNELDLTWSQHSDPPGARPSGTDRHQLVTQSPNGKSLKELQQLHLQLQDYHLELEQQHEELLQAQHAAEQAQARYQNLYDAAPLGYVTLDPAGLVEQLNQRACLHFKTEAERLVGRRFLTFVVESYRDAFQEFFGRILATETSHTLKVQLLADDGTIFDARLDGIAATDAAGQRNCRLALADISVLQHAIRQRREHYDGLQRALLASRQGVWEWSFASNELRWDERAQQCFGRTHDPNPVSFSVLAQGVHPADMASVQQALHQCVHHGAHLDITHRAVWPDGSVHYVAAYGHVIYDERGQAQCLSGLMRDVTARYAAEEELSHKNRLLDHILENLPVVLGRLNPAAEYLEMVGSGLRRVNVADNQLVGRTVFEVFPNLVEPTLRLLAGEQINFVGAAEHEDGLVYFQNYGYFDEQRQQGVFFAIDVTESEQAKDALRQKQEFTQSLLDHSTDAILAFDQQGRVTAWNHTMQQLTGKSEAQMLGQPLYDHVPFERDSLPGHVLEALLQGRAELHTHLTFTLPDPERHFDVTAIPLPVPPDSTGGGLLILRDVTELNHLQAQATQAQLRQQRAVLRAVLAAQEDERRRISEALHNGVGQILFGAKLNLENQLHHPDLPDKVMSLLNEAIQATRTVSFELTPIILEDFGLQTALQKLTRHLSPSALRVHLYLRGLEQPRPHVLDLALYRIVQELLNNILRHAQTAEATVHVVHDEQGLYLSVEDNGVGFRPELLDAAPRSLGVATIRNRVALFGGSMELISRPGRGTIVTITLPTTTEFAGELTT